MTGINLYENYYMAKANFRKHSLRIFKNNMCVRVLSTLQHFFLFILIYFLKSECLKGQNETEFSTILIKSMKLFYDRYFFALAFQRQL